MRILSQDGKFDFPYERVCLEVMDSGRIFAQGDIWGAKDNYIEAAKYSTEAKARKAMEMLKNEYYGYKVEETYHEGTEYYHPIFQFPTDDEGSITMTEERKQKIQKIDKQMERE